MDKILLLIEHKRNRYLLKELLNSKYKVALPDDQQGIVETFDLVILDEPALNKFGKQIQDVIKKEESVFTPVLLITAQQNIDFEKENSKMIDEFIKIPIRKEILQRRIGNLLKIRHLSLEVNERYYTLIENSPIGVCILKDGNIVYANPIFLEMSDREKQNVIGIEPLDLIHPEDRHKVSDYYKGKMTEKEVDDFVEVRHINSNGEIRWVDLRIASIDYKGESAELIIALDITARKQGEEEIKYLSFHDKLTGLYNRAYFNEELKRLDTKRQLPFSVIMGDVNGLKLINDAFDHQQGDELLVQISRIIEDCCRWEDIIARVGGDEFAILLPKTKQSIAKNICDRIKEVCKEAEQKIIQPDLALGVATKEKVEEDMEEVFKEAEDRMYRNKLTESASARNSIISSLEKTLKEKTHETKEHAERIKRLALHMGRELDLSQSTLDELSLLAVLHDMGKVAIPERILNKPGKLTSEEWRKIQEHPETGYRIVKSVPELACVADGVLSHHECWDGSGYPQGLKGKEIPLIARIITVVDAYDVMTHKRSYKESMSKQEALKEIKRCAGTQFDPVLTKKFIKLLNGNVDYDKTCNSSV